MNPGEYGTLFTESVEAHIAALVERVHYDTGGAFGEKGHTVLLSECLKCKAVRSAARQAIAEEVLR